MWGYFIEGSGSKTELDEASESDFFSPIFPSALSMPSNIEVGST